MTKLLPLLALPLALGLTACGGNEPRFMVVAPTQSAPVKVRVSTVELREVILPAYSEDSQILAEDAKGGLVAVKGGVWADGSTTAITQELARSIDTRSSAAVAAEPWPLTDPADVRLEVRILRAVARADGQFQLTGQYALAAPEGAIRDSLERFDIATPLAGTAPGDIATAYGAALGQLSDAIIARLARR